MNGVPLTEWVVIACIVLPFLFWGSPAGWLPAFRRWRRSRSPGAIAEASAAAAEAAAEATALAARVAVEMQVMARPTLLLGPAKSPGFSKLGGKPELPSGVSWPTGADGPRAFLAQFDIGELHASGGQDWLPSEGRLYMFLDEERGGFADHVQIICSHEAPGPPVPAPAALSRKLQFPERRVEFERFTSVPNPDWFGVDIGVLRSADRTVWAEVARIADAPAADVQQHRIGGYPNEIQETRMPLECEHLARSLPPPVWGASVAPEMAQALKSWRLLIQIDSDPALKMNWGDGGRLYVFIREEDARAAEFSRTVTLFQCY